MPFNPEDMIRWEELSNSLHERFRNIERMIDSRMSNITADSGDYRMTVSYEPPLNPELDKDIWFDLNIMTLRFYTAKGGDDETNLNKTKGGAWELTRGAWYGGNKNDVTAPPIPAPIHQYSRVKSLIWISNSAQNGQYKKSPEMPRVSMYSVPTDGWYRIQDRSSLFIYNSQYNYIHDGGQLRVDIVVQRKDNGYKDETLYTTTYESQSKFRSYIDATDSFPEFKAQLKARDRLFLVATTARDPKSTDQFRISQIASFYVYRLNHGDIDIQVGNITHDKYDKIVPSDTLNAGSGPNTPPVERLPIPFIPKIGNVFVEGTNFLVPIKTPNESGSAYTGTGNQPPPCHTPTPPPCHTPPPPPPSRRTKIIEEEVEVTPRDPALVKQNNFDVITLSKRDYPKYRVDPTSGGFYIRNGKEYQEYYERYHQYFVDEDGALMIVAAYTYEHRISLTGRTFKKVKREVPEDYNPPCHTATPSSSGKTKIIEQEVEVTPYDPALIKLPKVDVIVTSAGKWPKYIIDDPRTEFYLKDGKVYQRYRERTTSYSTPSGEKYNYEPRETFTGRTIKKEKIEVPEEYRP